MYYFQQLVSALRKQPPITIEFYPLEIYFMAQSCVFWLATHPKNKIIAFTAKKLQAALTTRYPHLQDLISRTLTEGTKNYHGNKKN